MQVGSEVAGKTMHQDGIQLDSADHIMYWMCPVQLPRVNQTHSYSRSAVSKT